MFKLMNNKKGFTLVELMIVVVIMAILVAVAVPIYSAVTRNAQNKTCASNARILSAQVSQIFMGTADGTESITSIAATKTITTTLTVGEIKSTSSTEKLSTMLQQGIPVCPFNDANSYVIQTNGAVKCSGWAAGATIEKPEH